MLHVDPDRNPVEVLAEEFVSRARNGEDPSIDEYVESHPDLADEIEALFPTVLAMEQLKVRKLAPTEPELSESSHPKRLGDFRIIREIGRGGMGIVYEAEQESLARRVALKTLPQRVLSDSTRLTRFKHESQTAARLHHTNIVPVFGVGEDDGLHYYVMQYIRGVGLDQILRQLRISGPAGYGASATTISPQDAATSAVYLIRPAADAARALQDGRFMQGGSYRTDSLSAASIEAIGSTTDVPFTAESSSDDELEFQTEGHSVPKGHRYFKSVAAIGRQVADALHYAHSQGTLHRDVKPANLLLDKQGTVWITDFGLAKATEPGQRSSTGDIVGTLRYMAPEQFSGTLDAGSDVYSLGATLYEMLALQPAFDDKDRGRLIRRVTQEDPVPLRQVNPAIPRDLATIVHKAMCKEPAGRYGSAAELSEDLARYQANLPIRARRPWMTERLWRWSVRNPTVAALSLCLLMLVAGSFSMVTWLWQRERTSHSLARSSGQRAESNLDLALDWIDDILSPYSAHWMSDPLEEINNSEAVVEPTAPAPQLAISEGNLALLRKALSFYDQLIKKNAGHPRLRRDSARAHRRIGDISLRLGDIADAKRAYQISIRLLNQLTTDFPDDTELWRATSATFRQLGLAHDLSNDRKKANEAYTRSLTLLKSHGKNDPVDLFERAKTLNRLGRFRGRRDIEKRANFQREALQILDRLIAQDTERSSRQYKYLQAQCYRNLIFAEMWRQTRRRNSSKKTPAGQTFDARQKAINILDQLVADYPEIPDYQAELSEVLSVVSFYPSNDDAKREQVVRDLLKSINISGQLISQFPSMPRYAVAQVRANQQLGRLLARSGQRREAIPFYRTALRTQESLSRKFRNGFFQFTRARLLLYLGKILHKEHQLLEAEKLLRESLAICLERVNANPESKRREFSLIDPLESLAAVLESIDQEEEAAQLRLQAEPIKQRLRQYMKQRFERRRRSSSKRKKTAPNA